MGVQSPLSSPRRASITDFKAQAPSDGPRYNIYDPLLVAVATGQLDSVRQVWAEGYNNTEHIATALHNAFATENMSIVRYLVDQQNIDIDTPNEAGQTLLHLACHVDSLSLVNELFNAGASLDQPQKNGWRPLHIAASKNSLRMATALVDRGADPSLPAAGEGPEHPTPLDIAKQAGNDAVADFLANETDPELLELKARKNKAMAKLAPGARSVVQDDHSVAPITVTRRFTNRLVQPLPEPLQSNVQRLPLSEQLLWDEFQTMDYTGEGYILKEAFKELHAESEDFGLPVDIDTLLKEYCLIGEDRLSFNEFCVLRMKMAQR